MWLAVEWDETPLILLWSFLCLSASFSESWAVCLPLTFFFLPSHLLLSLSCTHTSCCCFCKTTWLYYLISIASSIYWFFCTLIIPHIAFSLSYSGSGSNRSTPTASQAPATCCLSHPISCSELGTVLRPLSRAAQEIMEICSVDQTGCEDPDLETDTTAHTLYKLEEELRLLSKGTERQKDTHIQYIQTSCMVVWPPWC